MTENDKKSCDLGHDETSILSVSIFTDPLIQDL